MSSLARFVLILCLAALPAGAQTPAPPAGDNMLRIPGFPPIPLPPGARAFPDTGPAPAETAPPAASKAEAPKAREPFNAPRALTELFERLGKTADPDEARGIATQIQRIWTRTTSDTAEVLMARALTAMEQRNFDVSLEVLDKVVVLEPGWAEGWNRRATARWLADDLTGSVADIAQVLALEPRHFGALSGLAGILERSGFDKRALETWRRLKEIYPATPDIDKHIEKLTLDVEGREI